MGVEVNVPVIHYSLTVGLPKGEPLRANLVMLPGDTALVMRLHSARAEHADTPQAQCRNQDYYRVKQ
jgi:hypothetical protein